MPAILDKRRGRLRNILERALFLQKETVLAPSLPVESPGETDKCVPKASFPFGKGFKTLEQAEREFIQSTLTALSGNLTHTRTILGSSRSTLKKKLRVWGLR